MRVAWVSLAILFTAGSVTAEDRPENLIPLVRFYDHKFNQHLYSYTKEEEDRWRAIPHVKEHKILGDVATEKLPNTVPLWRGVRVEKGVVQHFYYIRTTGVPKNTMIDAQAFKAYVWTKPGDGRIPIYCTTWVDNSDAFFDPDLDVVRQNRDDTRKSTGVLRRGLAGQDTGVAVFYIYPHPEGEGEEKKADKSETDKPKAEGGDPPKPKGDKK